jgi:hypothetical protein
MDIRSKPITSQVSLVHCSIFLASPPRNRNNKQRKNFHKKKEVIDPLETSSKSQSISDTSLSLAKSTSETSSKMEDKKIHKGDRSPKKQKTREHTK